MLTNDLIKEMLDREPDVPPPLPRAGFVRGLELPRDRLNVLEPDWPSRPCCDTASPELVEEANRELAEEADARDEDAPLD